MNNLVKFTFKLLDLMVIFVMTFSAPVGVLAAPASQEAVPILSTDKAEYMPGDMVYVSGSGFSAGDYTFAAMDPGGTVNTWGTTPADAEGYLLYSTEVTLAGTYKLRAYPAGWSGDWGETALAIAGFTVAEVAPVPLVESDRPDYAPNDPVTLTGQSWQGDASVRLFVNDDLGQTWKRDVVVKVNEDGTFTDTFNLPDWFVATYVVSASGQQTGRVVKTTFTDSAIMIVDDNGPDDYPGQKDLSYLTVDYNPPTPGTLAVSWGWDDTAWSGNNTGDACTLFDTDADGFANYSFCVTVQNNPAVFKAARLYSCGDTRSDRCDQPTTLIPGFTSTAIASVTANADPFGVPGSPYYKASHVSGNTCDARTGCYTDDTVASVLINLSDVGGGTAKLINVCSYPSQEPNSAPSECVVTPNNGFLTIVKSATPNDSTAFVFNLGAGQTSQNGSSSWTINGSGSVQLISFAPGTAYDLSELVPTSWNLDSASCAIQTAPPTTTGTLVKPGINDFTVQSGLETICTFNDTQLGTIIVEKQTTPDGAAGNFTFTGDAAGTISDNGQIVVSNLAPGTYYSTETDPSPSFALGSIVCSDLNSSGDVATRTATFKVEAGETVKCTFTNAQQPGTLIVKKVVINDNGGTKIATNFSFQVNGGATTSFMQDGSDPLKGLNSLSVDAGTYSVTEPAVPGYTTTYNNCTNVVISNGGSATCTITNNDQPATLIVIKHVINDNGGTAKAADFTLDSGGANDTPDNFPGAEAPGTTITLDAGSYNVTETGPSGYTASFSAGCAGTIANGETKTCTVTNDDQAATLHVVKVVVNDNGGTKTFTDFSFQVNGGSAVAFEADGQNDLTVPAGTYTVTEPAVSGYTTTYNNCTNLIIPNGGSATCTITNNDQPGTLIVKKLVINNDGGTRIATDFSFQVNGGAATAFLQDGTDQLKGKNTLTVDAGIYNITEPAVAGYATTYDNCSKVVVPNGGSATCTITNDDITAHLKLVKVVTNDSGGTAVATDWMLSAAGPTPISGAGGVEADVKAGTYTLTEAGPAGYSSSAWVCVGGTQNGADITLANGESATCTITNDDKTAHLTLVKVVVNDNGGLAVAADWTLSAAGPTPISGKGGVDSDVNAGTYTLSETGPAGYAASAWSCAGGTQNGASITLANGQSATCTITNNDIAPKLHLRKVVVNDNGGSAMIADFTLTADGTGSNDLSGTSPVDSGAGLKADTWTLSETSLPGYTASGWLCAGGSQQGSNITLKIGEEATCTITNDDQQAYITVVKVVNNNYGGTAKPDDFKLTLDGKAVSSGMKVAVNPGTYTAAETQLYGYTFAGFSGDCDSSGKITVALGQSRTCTLTNNDIQPRLKLVKTVVNDNGGNAKADDFHASVSGTDVDWNVFVGFNAGSYDANETSLTGYTASGWTGDCAADGSVILKVGDTKTCYITNDDVAPKLTLIKNVINDNGGNALPDDFKLTIGGKEAKSGVTYELMANTPYALNETLLTGYTFVKISGDAKCPSVLGGTVTLDEGDNVTCTITNDDVAPTLTLVKYVVNDDGGNAVIADFPLFINGNTVISGAANILTANTLYTASETTLTGYTPSVWGGDCAPDGTITLNEGDNKTCTITNNDVAPTLKLVKLVKNDNGGNAVANDWTLAATAAAPYGGRNFSNLGGSGVFKTVYANTAYDLSESSVTGYSTGSWSCTGGKLVGSTVTLSEGETGITCTITNDDIAPTLTLIKTVVNDDGGNAVVSDFKLFIDKTQVTSGAANTLMANTLYTASETTLAGYTASAWGGDCAPNGAITLNEGDNKVCTITNNDVAPTLKLVKIVDNGDGGNAVANDWTLSATATAPLDGRNFSNAGGSGVFNKVYANTAYDLAETFVTGYTAGSWSCTGGTLVGSKVTLSEGETGIVCTITNNDVAPKLTLVKIVVNDDGGNAVVGDFPLFINSTPVTSGVANTLKANTLYTASETTHPGYAASVWGGDCSPDGTITLNEGDNKTCTITNNDVAPTLTVIKKVINDHGGKALPNDFKLTIGGAPATSGTAYKVKANTLYAIDETQLPGYSFVSITGDPECPAILGGTVTLDEGENVTCTITNDDQPAKLIVIKHVINDNGGTAKASDFTLDSGGTDDTPDDFPGAEAPGTTVTLDAGSYNVTEKGPAGYSASFSADCTGTIANGETKTCTVTNDDIQPKLIVIKHVINDNGGTAVAGDFTMAVTGSSPSPASFPGAEAPGTTVAINAGAYSVSETGPSGYAPSFSADCTGSIAVGHTKTCTVTNNDIQPRLIVIKHVINDNGGMATAANFTMKVTGNSANPPSFPGAEAPGTNVAINAGAYSVSETGPSGYAAAFSADCSGTIAIGEIKTCTVTNDDIQPKLIVIKHVINDNGGTAVAGNFTMAVTGSSPSPASFPGAEAPGTTVAINAGAYSVKETGPVGYAASFSADCNSTIAVGQVKTCTITNNDIAPTLKVIKLLYPSTDTGRFNLLIDGVVKAGSVGNNGTTNAVPVNVGLHTVSETAYTGFSLANYVTTIGGDCNPDGTISLALAENKTCYITNTRRGTIIVEKQTSPDKAPGLFTFTGTTAGTIADNGTITVANLAPGTYTSTEADPAGQLFKLTSIVCNDGTSAGKSTGNVLTRTATFKLDPGETVKCTFTNTKNYHPGTIGFWKNWRNHYTSTQFQLLINYLKTNNPKVYNKDLVNNTADDLTIAKADAIFNVGSATPREQMLLAQLTGLKFDLAITKLQGTSGLVQKNNNICTAAVVDVSGISGATAYFGTSKPTVQTIVSKVEAAWTGKLTLTRTDWTWNLTLAQKDMLIKVLTGINEGTLVMSTGCP